MRFFAVTVALAFLASAASAQTPCPSGTTAARVRCLDAALAAETASRQATDNALSRDNDALEKTMHDADDAIRLRLEEQAEKIDDLLARVAALEAGGVPLPPEPDPDPTPTPEPGPAFPNTSDGKPISQLNVYWWRYWSFEEPFIDLTKGTNPEYTAVLHGGARVGYQDLWAQGHIDKATGWPKSFPPNTWFMQGGRLRFGAGEVPSGYAGTWVLTWEGDGDLEFSMRACSDTLVMNCWRRIGAGRAEAVFDAASTDPGDWKITRLGPGGVKNIRAFRKANEALLASGKILNPRFASHARRYKVLRYVLPQEASEGRPFRPGDFARMDQASWAPNWKGDYAKAPEAPKQPPFEAIFRMSMETDTAAWVHVAGLPGAPAAFNALVEPADAGLWNDACRTHFAAIVASPDWAAYMDAIVAGLVAARYPASRMVYLEPWNEVWNYGGPWARMTHCAMGVTNALGGMRGAPGWGPRYGYGWLAAHVMVEFDKALKRAGRKQAWTLAMGSQMAWDAVTIGGLEGFRRYFADKGADPAPWLKNVGVSTASYYDYAFSPISGYGLITVAASNAEWDANRDALMARHRQAWREAILADPAGLARRRADQVISGAGSATLSWVLANRRRHREVAQSYGAYFLGDYEGESHETMPHWLAADPVIVNWAEDWIAGPEGERVTRAWANAMKADDPKAIISNYMGIQPRDPEGASPTDTKFADPWYDGYYGEENGRTRGLKEIER